MGAALSRWTSDEREVEEWVRGIVCGRDWTMEEAFSRHARGFGTSDEVAPVQRTFEAAVAFAGDGSGG